MRKKEFQKQYTLVSDNINDLYKFRRNLVEDFVKNSEEEILKLFGEADWEYQPSLYY